MMVDAQIIPTDGLNDQRLNDQAIEKKEKSSSKLRRKRSKSQGKRKSSKKEINIDKSEELYTNGDKNGQTPELKIQVEIKDNSSTWNSREFHDQGDNPDTWDETDELKGEEDQPPQHVPKVPSRQRSTKKGKKSSRRQSDKTDRSASEKDDHNKHLHRPRRTTSDTSIDKSVDTDDQEEKIRVSGRSLKSTRSRGPKEDKKPSVPRRGSDARDRDDNSVDKPSSGRSLGKKLRQKDEEGTLKEYNDKQPTKPGRRSRRVSPDSKSDDDDDLNVGSFHSLRKDSDKPRRRSRSNTSKKRTPTSSRKNKTPTGNKVHRRKLKDKTPNGSDDAQVSNDTEASDDVDENGTQEISLKDDETSTPGSIREKRRERRKDRERLGSNGDSRKMKTSSSHGSRSSRSSLSSRRDGMRKSHSERWNRAAETAEGEGAENPPVVKRRLRASDGLSRSAHSRVRRNNSSGLSRMKGSLNNRSYHGVERDRRGSSDGRRTPKRSARRNQSSETFSSVDDSIESLGDAHSFGDGRSQATLESIDDFEDFGEDFYGMEMQTPGMIDFEEEMLDLMQRANPEVTDHLDRRVHRKREMVVYDHNMPMMTRQALLTRQASSQVQRQFFDGSNIDKNRLLLRNDSMTSNNSSHRGMRSTHGRRAPPRAKSSGLGAMGRGGYMDSNREPTDRRGVFRSRSSQTASFNQYYQNKPNKVRNLSRRASGDLVQPHGQRPRSGGEHRRRPVQRAASTTALKRASSADHALQKPERKMSDDRLEEDKDMSNKRNRSKLHFLMYMTKMNVDMDDLFKKVREGETPRSPIDSLRMPSP